MSHFRREEVYVESVMRRSSSARFLNASWIYVLCSLSILNHCQIDREFYFPTVQFACILVRELNLRYDGV